MMEKENCINENSAEKTTEETTEETTKEASLQHNSEEYQQLLCRWGEQ